MQTTHDPHAACDARIFTLEQALEVALRQLTDLRAEVEQALRIIRGRNNPHEAVRLSEPVLAAALLDVPAADTATEDAP